MRSNLTASTSFDRISAEEAPAKGGGAVGGVLNVAGLGMGGMMWRV
jgi:formiminotetrahydrofolate cyclodeaminase